MPVIMRLDILQMSQIHHDSPREFEKEPGSPAISICGMIDPEPEAEETDADENDCTCISPENEPTPLGPATTKPLDPEPFNPTQLEEILKEKEKELREDYQKILEREKAAMQERFEFILLNEQTRTSFMLREAHRERQEKIHALQTQLQCKNLAALMYVMCTERRRSRIEKLKIIQDYTNYIGVLQDILVQGQELILHLSRGYKTAARVDHEWREKMKKVVSEFMSFIYNFAGGDPETNQYLIDLPKLLKTKAPVVDNPEEDPCFEEEEEEGDWISVQETPEEKFWWDELDTEDRPFVMYGDMADFKPEKRREVLKHIRPKKTAPQVWKKFAFRDMFLMSKCLNLDAIKDKYKLPVPVKWECAHAHSHPENGSVEIDLLKRASRASLAMTIKPRSPSIDIRGMGSILKIITSSPNGGHPPKTALLGARDSMEIASTTKMRERQSHKQNSNQSTSSSAPKEVILDIGKKRASVFEEVGVEEEFPVEPSRRSLNEKLSATYHEDDKEDQSTLGSIHNDSIRMKHPHEPEQDKIHLERVCPVEMCQRLQVDSFMRSLPPYMRANPFTHFEQRFEEYETCTPAQLEILKQRIENKKLGDTENETEEVECPLEDWVSTGVGVQTSFLELLPPCTCEKEAPLKDKSSSFMFDLADLMPVKLAMDAVHRECFYDDRVDFNRFEVIGQDKGESKNKTKKPLNIEFKHARYEEIKKILTTHPSLLDIFQANAK